MLLQTRIGVLLPLLALCLEGRAGYQVGVGESVYIASGQRCAPMSLVLRLRGGADNGPRQVATRVIMLPTDAEDLQDAVNIVEHQNSICQQVAGGIGIKVPEETEEGEMREILVSVGMPDKCREWGSRLGGFKPLTIRGTMLLRMEDTVRLKGPINLLSSSRGMFIRWNWRCGFHLRLPQAVGLQVAGGPWQVQRCVLRAEDMPVMRAHEAANISLLDSFVGGLSPHISDMEQDQTTITGAGKTDEDSGRCTHALVLEGNCSVSAADCTLQYCGAWGSAAAVIGGCAHLRLFQCFLFQNLGCGVSIHQAADVELVQSSMMQLGGGCFRAVLADRAHLRLFNLTLEGQKWHDQMRPGILEEEGELVVETKRRRLQAPEIDPQAKVLADIDDKAPHIEAVWSALTQELASNYSEVMDALESYCNITGATCRRERTGRQRLKSPGYIVDVEAIINSTVDPLYDRLQPASGSGWEDLPPLLLADFSSLAETSAQTTLCVYVHVDPLILSALRDPSQIAEGQALLIEHSDRYLSRRRFGGDASRIVPWLAALQAYVNAGSLTPVRVKMIFDFLEEAHSPILSKRLAALARGKGADAFLRSVDYVCVMHGDWLTPWRPCLLTSFRGLSTFFLTSSAPWGDLHSGCYGGARREPLADLVAVLSQLTFANGSVCIPGLTSLPLSPREMELLKSLSFRDDSHNLPPGWEATPPPSSNYSAQRPPPPPAHLEEGLLAVTAGGEEECEDESLIELGRTWFRPSLSLHGISGGWYIYI